MRRPTTAVRAPVDDVADDHDAPPSELGQQSVEQIESSVDVANDCNGVGAGE
jgi:hypothetical protein